MVSGHGLPRLVVAGFWLPAGPKDAKAFQPDIFRTRDKGSGLSGNRPCIPEAGFVVWTLIMPQVLDKINGKDRVTLSVLKKRRDFLRIAAARTKWVSKSMVVQMAETPAGQAPGPGQIRVGYTASKKVGNAVRRNRAKRRLREVVRHILPGQGWPGHDYVLIARNTSADTPFDQLIRDFSWCLRRLKDSRDNDKDRKTPEKGPDKSQRRG